MTTERRERHSKSASLDLLFDFTLPVRHRGRTRNWSIQSLVDHQGMNTRRKMLQHISTWFLALLLLDILVLSDTELNFSVLGVLQENGVNLAIAPLIGAGLIAGGAGLLQSGINAWQSRRNTDRTIRENRRMAEYQYSKDLEMWNRTNEYNSPEMQMLRLKNAGLNPNLVYGSGGAAGNTAAATMPKYNAPSAQYNYLPVVDVTSAIGAYQDMQVRQAQVDNMKAQRNLTEQKYLSESFMTRMKARRNTAEHTLENQPFNLYLDALKADYELKRTKSTLTKSVGDYQLEFAKGRVHQQSTQIQKMVEDMKRTQAATEFTKLQNEWYVTKMISQFGLGLANQINKVAPWRGLQNLPKGGSFKTDYRGTQKSFENTTRELMRGRFRD